MILIRLLALLIALTLEAGASRRILFLTHSAGFRHDSIPAAVRTLEGIGQRTGAFTVTATEDVSSISATGLAPFDAVFFFTSGELALSDQQKRDLLAFVRSGKGFGGAHSATDTLYTWPEYGDLIGAYFSGHPWVQEVGIDIEDPDFPGERSQAPRFRIVEEIYQFRDFSRDRVRVLQTLDTATVDLNAAGVSRTDNDFALSWCRSYGEGRVFYTALGHFDETWRDPRFQQMLEGALLWLTGEVVADATPRSTSQSPRPLFSTTGVKTLDGRSRSQAPGSLVRIEGAHLTSGSSLRATTGPLPQKLAGTRVELEGRPLPLLSAAPERLEVQLPVDLQPGSTPALQIWIVNQGSEPVLLPIVAAAPALLGARRTDGVLVLYATGLGEVTPVIAAGETTPLAPFSVLRQLPRVLVNGTALPPFFAGLAPSLVGVYQINAALPDGLAVGHLEIEIEADATLSNRMVISPDSQIGFAADSAPLR